MWMYTYIIIRSGMINCVVQFRSPMNSPKSSLGHNCTSNVKKTVLIDTLDNVHLSTSSCEQFIIVCI